MADTEQAAGGRTTFGATIVQHLGGAVLVIGVVAGAFWAIGSMDDDTETAPVAADAPEESDPPDAAEEPDEADEGEDEPPEEPEEVEGEDVEEPPADDGDGDDTDPDDTDPAEDEPAEDEPADDEPTDDAPDEGATDDEPSGDDEEPQEPSGPAVDPTTVTVQVLDGYQDDGGSAADAVAGQLEGAGYDIIARNPALRYDQTAVLFNAGSEDAARQIAAEIGAAEVREQPGNLSTAVDLHVVVGADRG